MSVGTNDFITNPIKVEKGVLQGDSLSPVIFNMCFDTLIRTIENRNIKLMGYNYTNALTPHHWSQFGDNTALATATQKDSQALLNVLVSGANAQIFLVVSVSVSVLVYKKNGKQSS